MYNNENHFIKNTFKLSVFIYGYPYNISILIKFDSSNFTSAHTFLK